MSRTTIAADNGVLNTQKFYAELDRLMGASIGVIAIRTREASRGKLLLHQWASMRGMDFAVWDVLVGFQTYRAIPVMADGTEEVAIEPDAMASYLAPSGKINETDNILQGTNHYRVRADNKASDNNMFCGVLMGVSSEWLEIDMVQQQIRDHVQRAYQSNDRMILMLAPGTAIPDAIAGDVEVIELSPPSYAELYDCFVEMETEIPDGSADDKGEETLNFGYVPDDDDRARIVQNGMGMTQQEFENAISLAIVDISAKLENLGEDEEHTVTADDFISVVRERKLDVLKQTQILELMPEANANNVGGLDLLMAQLALVRVGFTPRARAFGIKYPKGYLVVGPPGVGKTLICQATSYVLGVPAIKFDLSGVFNSLLGSTEQRMKACLKMAEDMAPCILFIDEIDKATSGAGSSSGDGGVATRVFGTLITWMQEKSNREIPVYVIASANNVQNIPPELMRKGRFDNIWSVPYPSDKERAGIFKIHVEKRGHELTHAEYVKLAKQTKNFSGAEIESAVEEALLLDFVADAEQLQFETVLKCIDNTVPQSKAFPEKIKAMADWCKDNARPASSLSSFDVEAVEAVKPAGIGPKPVRRMVIKPAKRSTRN